MYLFSEFCYKTSFQEFNRATERSKLLKKRLETMNYCILTNKQRDYKITSTTSMETDNYIILNKYQGQYH